MLGHTCPFVKSIHKFYSGKHHFGLQRFQFNPRIQLRITLYVQLVLIVA